MKRMPDGIDGEFFYEKSAPSHTPDWLGRCVVQSEEAKGGEIDYLTIDDAAGLLYVANLGCIEFHPLHSRCPDVDAPGLPVLRSRSVRALHLRGRARRRPAHQGPARPAGPAVVPEDERRDRAADLRAGAARRLHPRHRARLRRRGGPPDQGCRPRPRHDGLEDRRSHREDLHRPQHEPLGREHRGRLLGASRASCAGLDPAHVGRGVRGRVRAGRLPHRQRLGTVRAGGRPVRRRSHRGAPISRRRSRRSGSTPSRRDDDAPGRPSTRRFPGPRPGASRPDLRGDRRGLEGSGVVRVRAPARLRTRGHDRAGARRGDAGRQLLRDPQASRDATALRRAARARRRAAVVGRAEGPADRQGRQAARRADRGASRSSTGRSRARSPRGTTAPARCASSTTAGTNRSSGPTRRSRSCCTAGAIRVSSSTS